MYYIYKIFGERAALCEWFIEVGGVSERKVGILDRIANKGGDQVDLADEFWIK